MKGGARALWLTWAALILIEGLAFSFRFSGVFGPLVRRPDAWALIGYFGAFERILLCLACGLAVVLGLFLREQAQAFQLIAGHRPGLRVLFAHLACAALLWFVLSAAKRYAGLSNLPAADGLVYGLIALFPLSSSGLLVTAALLFAPLRFWGQMWQARKGLILCVALISVAYACWLSFAPRLDAQNWLMEQLFVHTVQLAGWMDGLLGYPTHVVASTRAFGTSGFDVNISDACLGYQGASLVLLLLGAYVLMQRRQLKFPLALVVLPCAAMAVWLLNSVRIAALIIIGTEWSPDIAQQGFHSAAGWVNVIVVSMLAIWVLGYTALFTRTPSRGGLAFDDQAITLLPQVVLLGLSFLTLLGTAEFDWLYPVRMLVTGLVLVWFWRRFALGELDLRLLPVGMGVLVFVIWIGMLPNEPAVSRQFALTLFSAPVWLVAAWMVCRVIGAGFVVPLVEELAFRGFLLELLERRAGQWLASQTSRRVASVALTSLAFGLLHGAWLAGMIAGVGFALARLWRGRVMDAVVAHAVTNLLLAGYVLWMGYWSYW